MNLFKRTAYGLENSHLFYKVNLVIYVEGGKKCFTKAEVYEDPNNFNDKTNDIVFWNKIFERFCPKERIKSKSVGSKTVLKEIAKDIINRNLKKVMIGMDSEFDDIYGRGDPHPNILYTYGHSWENDAWNSTQINLVLERVSAIKNSGLEAIKIFEKFLKEIRIAVYADAYMFKKTSASKFFQRAGGNMSFIQLKASAPPHVIKTKVRDKLVDMGLNTSTLYAFGRRRKLKVSRHCYGHLLGDYICQLIDYYLREEHGLKSIPHDSIHRMALADSINSWEETDSKSEHYKALFSRVR